jgi:signal transduction histidine kinase
MTLSNVPMRKVHGFKLKTTIVGIFFLMVILLLFINVMINRLVLDKELSDELVSGGISRIAGLADLVQESVMQSEEDKITSVLFDYIYSSGDTAYLMVWDGNNKLIAHTFIGKIPEGIADLHVLPDDADKEAKLILVGNSEIYDIAVKLDYGQGLVRAGIYKDKLDGMINKTINRLLLIGIIPLIAALFFISYFTRLILKPVNNLKSAVGKISQGDLDQIIEIKSNDEIGELSAQFNKMTSDLRISRKEVEDQKKKLEKMVAGKTAELRQLLAETQGDKAELEKQRIATLNILEDVQQSEEGIKQANQELEKKKFELESMNSLNDQLVSTISIEEAIVTFNGNLKKIMQFNTATYMIFNPLKRGEIVFRAYLNEPVGESLFDSIKKELSNFMSYYGEEMKYELSAIASLKPDFFGEKLDNSIKTVAMSSFILPLNIGNRIVGAIHVSSVLPSYYRYKQVGDEIIRAITATFAATIARLQAQNQAQQSKTESLVNGLSDGVIMFSREKKIILKNPAFLRLESGKIIISSLTELDDMFPEESFSEAIDKMLKDGEPYQLLEAEQDKHFFQVYITPVKSPGGQTEGGAIIFHDITQLKEIDRMKSEFVSVASHQLRTPLTAIKLFTEMLAKGDVGPLNKDQKDYIDNVSESTERMVRLVNDLLSLSRLESGKLRIDPQLTQLAEMINALINELKPIAALKKCEIIFERPKKEVKEVMVDSNLMRQVVHNLLTNALRYCKDGNGRIRVGLEQTKTDYLIRVSDNGIGIAEKDKASIFRKFFRADNAVKVETEGSGLGLYVCQMIMEASQGKIWFESDIGKGTTFYASLPLEGMRKKEGDKSLPDATV